MTTQTKPKSRLSSLFDTTPVPSSSTSATVKPKVRSAFSSLFDTEEDSQTKKTDNEAASASDAPGDKTSSKVEITKVFDFAGEAVK